jgi:hypothetical protein
MTNTGRGMFWSLATLLALCAMAVPLFAQDEEQRLANSAIALQQILSEHNGLPKTLCLSNKRGVSKNTFPQKARVGKSDCREFA